MMKCSEIRPRIALYIDREVTGAEALEFEAHLTECAECRREYDEMRGTVDAVRGATPLYDAAEKSYAAVRGMVAGWERRQRLRRWATAAALAAAVAVLIALAIPRFSTGRSEYEQFAARAHRNFANGAFPLDVSSSQPRVVSSWLEPRVPFHLTLPNYPEGGQKRYALAGARLMQYRGEDVAYLAYEMDRKPISLLISSSSKIVPSGGESYRSGGLTFYFSSEEGLRIISWKDKGLIYAQVSDLDVKGAESCAICHGAEGERRKFEGLGKRM
jgi:anti-sigma factor RsiW